ncbi:unnamed protein product [Choristocarpus tenellus]
MHLRGALVITSCGLVMLLSNCMILTCGFQVNCTPRMGMRRIQQDGSGMISRGDFLASSALLVSGLSGFLFPELAGATGLLDYPPRRLNNRYFLVRAGESGSDQRGIIQSHPIDKLNEEDNGLTEAGVKEALRAAGVLESLGVGECFIWADISSRAQGTARIIARQLGVRQDRLVPEYSFLDPRGMGILDGRDSAAVLPSVYLADSKNSTWRPPPNTNGTPHESVSDVFVRVRQLMSKLETQYLGEDIILVSSDSDCLSVLQTYALGEELGKHSRYFLRPGEGRQMRVSADTDVTYDRYRLIKGATDNAFKDFADVDIDEELAATMKSDEEQS